MSVRTTENQGWSGVATRKVSQEFPQGRMGPFETGNFGSLRSARTDKGLTYLELEKVEPYPW